MQKQTRHVKKITNNIYIRSNGKNDLRYIEPVADFAYTYRSFYTKCFKNYSLSGLKGNKRQECLSCTALYGT